MLAPQASVAACTRALQRAKGRGKNPVLTPDTADFNIAAQRGTGTLRWSGGELVYCSPLCSVARDEGPVGWPTNFPASVGLREPNVQSRFKTYPASSMAPVHMTWAMMNRNRSRCTAYHMPAAFNAADNAATAMKRGNVWRCGRVLANVK